jgi:hypothetical protein
MPELTKESIALFGYLLPGLLAAWVLYGLTSDPKPSQVERIIQALIFTFIVHVLLVPLQWSLQFLGALVGTLRPWDETSRDLARLILALSLGLVLAIYTNTDTIHTWLRTKGLTTRTAYPSEWFSVLARTVTFVVLHMHDERRLYGWPKEWPNEPDKGHFFILFPSWIQEDGSQLELEGVHGLLVASKDVKWVEFVGQPQRESSAQGK